MELNYQINGNEVLAVLTGRLDTNASKQFAIDFQPIMDQADKKIILDCKALDFISSSGLRLFIALRKATIAKGGSVVIKDMQEALKNVFTMVNFQTYFIWE